MFSWLYVEFRRQNLHVYEYTRTNLKVVLPKANAIFFLFPSISQHKLAFIPVHLCSADAMKSALSDHLENLVLYIGCRLSVRILHKRVHVLTLDIAWATWCRNDISKSLNASRVVQHTQHIPQNIVVFLLFACTRPSPPSTPITPDRLYSFVRS